MSENPVDLKAYSEMKELMEEVLPELIETFVGYMPTLLEELTEAIEDDDPELIFTISHRMKSSSNSLGALGLAKTCETIEMIGRAGSTEDALEYCDQLDEQLTEVLAFFEEELKSLN